jgi:putative SOS response-associated peptidase YedK
MFVLDPVGQGGRRMCGRIAQNLSSQQIAELFAATPEVDEAGGHFNVAPAQPLPVVDVKEGRRVVVARRWGLVPAWASDPAIGARLINARAETVADKPAFRAAFRRHRCLVPATAFYEWAARPGGKVPHAIRRRDGQPLALAGIAATGAGPEGERLATCAVITTAANGLLRPIHGRMPALLAPDAWDRWLDPATEDLDGLRALLVPWPQDDLVAYPVGRRVNDARNDGPELLRPLRQDAA